MSVVLEDAIANRLICTESRLLDHCLIATRAVQIAELQAVPCSELFIRRPKSGVLYDSATHTYVETCVLRRYLYTVTSIFKM